MSEKDQHSSLIRHFIHPHSKKITSNQEVPYEQIIDDYNYMRNSFLWKNVMQKALPSIQANSIGNEYIADEDLLHFLSAPDLNELYNDYRDLRRRLRMFSTFTLELLAEQLSIPEINHLNSSAFLQLHDSVFRNCLMVAFQEPPQLRNFNQDKNRTTQNVSQIHQQMQRHIQGIFHPHEVPYAKPNDLAGELESERRIMEEVINDIYSYGNFNGDFDDFRKSIRIEEKHYMKASVKNSKLNPLYAHCVAYMSTQHFFSYLYNSFTLTHDENGPELTKRNISLNNN